MIRETFPADFLEAVFEIIRQPAQRLPPDVDRADERELLDVLAQAQALALDAGAQFVTSFEVQPTQPARDIL